MLSVQALASKFSARSLRSTLRTPARDLIERLEDRRLLANLSFEFTDADGDFCQVQITNATAPITATFTAGVLTLSGAGAGSVATISLTGADNAGTGDNRISLTRLVSTGIRTINANQADVLTSLGTNGVNVSGARTLNIGDVGGNITAGGGSGQTRLTFNARVLNEAVFVCPVIIDSFTALNYLGGGVTAPSIVEMRIESLLPARGPLPIFPASFNITTTDPTLDFGVKNIRIVGSIAGGTWNTAARINSIRVGDVTPSGGQFWNVTVAGHLGSLISDETLDGTFAATSFGTIRGITISSPTVTTPGGIDSLRANQLGGSFTAGPVGQIIATTDLSALTLVCTRLNTIIVNRDIEGSFITVNGQIGQNGLGTMTVGRQVLNSVIRINNTNANTITISGIQNSTFYIGVNTNVAANTLVNNLNQFTNQTGSVNSFRINALPGNPFNFVNSFVAFVGATTFQSTARVQGAAGGNFGLTIVQVNAFSMRQPNGATFNGLSNVSDGQFRFINL